MELGDYHAGDTIRWKFATRNSSGVLTALASGSVAMYKNDTTTEFVTGITLTASFDGVTGMNHISVDTSSTTAYDAGSTFMAVLSAGTVNSVTVTGEPVGRFTLGRYLKPATAGRQAVVDASGQVTIGALPTNFSALSITAGGAVTIGALPTNFSALSITAGGAVTIGALPTNFSALSITAAGRVTIGPLPTNFDALAITTTGAVTVGTNNDKTGYALTAAQVTSIGDTLLDRDMSAVADNGSASRRTPLQALRFLRNKWALAGTTGADLSVYKEDDSTASWTGIMSATASATPVTGMDPA